MANSANAVKATAVTNVNTAIVAAVQKSFKNDPVKAVYSNNLSFIEQLIIEQEVWSDGAYKTSNDMLYDLLAKCQAKYEEMCADNAAGKKLRDDLNNYITLHNIGVNKKSHTLIKIVKCVFGANKRRVSAYSIVLRTAVHNKVKSAELAEFIRNSGGVEEIRLAKNGTVLTVTQKAEVAMTAVKAEVLAEFESEAIATQLDAANVGQQIVFVATQLANGKFVVNAVSNSTTAVNAALAAYYSAHKKVINEKKVEGEVAGNDKDIADAIADAT